MKYILISLLLTATMGLCAQPIPVQESAEPTGYYIFTVYTPTSRQEAAIWSFQGVDLTTHRLVDRTDSTTMAFRPVEQTSLRTYMTTVSGAADAGAMEVVEEQGSPAIEELLVYPSLLSPKQRQLTESYLAIKHGLTLNQRLPVNYLAPSADGTGYPVWTAIEAQGFQYRIIGLAKDTASNLNRIAGHSVLAPGQLTVSWPAAPEETAYLVLADNGGPTARSPNSAPLQRRWRCEATGQVPPTTLAFDSRRFFARATPGEAWSLHLTTADGTIASYHTTASTDAKLVFEDIAFPANQVSLLDLAPAPKTQSPAITDFFTAVQLSPNPVSAGRAVQLRAALARPAALILSVYDVAGRLLEERRLATTTHHLAEISFPEPGTYTLHLRPRLNTSNALIYTLKVVVH